MGKGRRRRLDDAADLFRFAPAVREVVRLRLGGAGRKRIALLRHVALTTVASQLGVAHAVAGVSDDVELLALADSMNAIAEALGTTDAVSVVHLAQLDFALTRPRTSDH